MNEQLQERKNIKQSIELIPELKASIDKLIFVLCGDVEKRGWMSTQEQRTGKLEDQVRIIVRIGWSAASVIGVSLLGAVMVLILK